MSYCCVNCFKDNYIKNTIKNENLTGDCDFCSSKNVSVIDISKENPVSEMILRLIQAYSISNDKRAVFLKESLRDDWDIFNVGCENIHILVKSLCGNNYKEYESLFTNKVILSQKYDDDFQHEYGLLRGLSWNDFSEYIKYKNRFHNSHFNSDAFASILSSIRQEIGIDKEFYRARICKNSDGYDKEDMYGPPKGLRCAGRINPEEIGVLYLSSDRETVLYETRANVYDYITIGTFKAVKPLKLVNLSEFSNISPFLYDDDYIDKFAINRSILHEISMEIAKPVRRNDSLLEYLPTQYISEFIKNEGYDGVAYRSTIKNEGYNYALFNEKLVECT